MLLLNRALLGVGGAGGPLVNYDFTTGSLPAGITFTRSSSATYYNSSGVLSSAGTDVARFDYNPSTLAIRGLLIEESRTNSQRRSEEFDNAAWTANSITVTANSVAAPDGATTAETAVPSIGTASGKRVFDGTAPINTTNPVTYSAYVKDSGYNQIGMRENLWSGSSAVFSVASGGSVTGTYTATATVSNAAIVDVGGGWFRVSATFDFASATDHGVAFYPFDGTWASGDAQSHSWTADGSSGVYLWGVQMELGSTVSSYIPTTSGSATRSADAASFTIPSGVSTLRYTFDDDTTQDVSVSSGAYNIPTNLNRPHIKSIVSI